MNNEYNALLELLTIPGPSGDESAVAAWLETALQAIPDVQTTRIGDNIVAVRGTPRTAIFAHTDTTGFTLGYDKKLIRIGGPDPRDKDRLRCDNGLTGRIRVSESGPRGRTFRLSKVRDSNGKKAAPTPGTRWVYARKPRLEKGTISAPYLDNRAGVWAALEALRSSPNSAVAFCTGEEAHGHGARVCADYLYRQHQITQALIADITWHTDDTPCGSGVVISLRDGSCPRQVFLDRVLTLAGESGISHQREIQSAGGSDGGHLLRSSVPIDWVFVGAPEKDPHTARERLTLSDLAAMRDLLIYLTERL